MKRAQAQQFRRPHDNQRPHLSRLHALKVEVKGVGVVSFPCMGSPLLFARSTGLKIWPGAESLATFIAEKSCMEEAVRAIDSEAVWRGWQGKHVMEIGCGLALLSIVAHHLGASVSLATDGDADLVYVARKNIECNIDKGKGILMANVL